MNDPDIHAAEPRFILENGISRLQLSLAVNDYDHIRDLASGAVRAEGIVLTPQSFPVEELFFRFTYHQEWDVSEMSFAKYVSLTAAGGAPMVALPVFPSRVFRHSAIYVRGDGWDGDPGKLEGRTVGIPEWAQTAGVYVRGLLGEFYGVDLRAINWVQAGVNQPGRTEKVKLNLPAGIRYASRGETSLNAMLLSGEIDAAITARPPAAFHDPGTGIRRLFPDPRAEERRYYQTTGVFPIMHVVAMRRDVYEANRWIAVNLYKAFTEAKDRCLDRLRDITASPVPLPWIADLVNESTAAIGADFWPYGIDPNLNTLEAFCRYAHEQGVASRQLKVEELFPKEVLKTVKV